MSRPAKDKAIDGRRVDESQRIEFLYWQYANRKFYLDLTNGVFDFSEWNKNYFDLFRIVAKRYSLDKVCVDGVFISKDDAFDGNGIIRFYGDAPKFLFDIVNEMIAQYHCSINDNPELTCDYIYKCENIEVYEEVNSESYRAFVNDVIKEHSVSLECVRSVCIEYGYFPDSMILALNAIEDYKSLCRNEFDLPELFIRAAKYSNVLRTHFVSEKGKCYFENHEKGFLYIYCNACTAIDIDRVMKETQVAISRVGKRNFIDELRYSDDPNMQLCIDIHCDFQIKEILDEVKLALLCAMNYYMPFRISFSRDMQDVQWRVLRAKHSKLSYLRRFVGLFVWDMVHQLNLRLGEVISVLIEIVNDQFYNTQGSSLPEAVIGEIREWSEVIRSYNASKGNDKANADVIDAKSVDREYRLAVRSILSGSICQHVSGIVSK